MGAKSEVKVAITSLYDDKGTKGAVKALGGFKSAVSEAEGFSGKLKAGWSSASDSIQANAGALAMGAGAALVAFGAKALSAFESVARQALTTGEAMGTTTEAASRWIAVADDAGISAEAFSSAAAKIPKSLSKEAWDNYGIATRDAGGKIRDTTDILLDALEVIGRQPGAAAQAQAGNDLLGKGYKTLAPLVGHTRAEMEKMLASVEKGQVITDAESASAERMRIAEDALQDALQEVTLAVGGFVAELAPSIELMAKATSGLVDMVSGTDESASGWEKAAKKLFEYGTPVGLAIKGFKALSVAMDDTHGVTADYEGTVTSATIAEDKLVGSTNEASGSFERLGLAAGEANQELADSKAALHDLGVEFDKVTGKFNNAEAIKELADASGDLAEKQAAGAKAQTELWVATEKYNKAMNTPSKKDDAKALEELTQAQENVKAAADATSDSYINLGRTLLSQIDKLKGSVPPELLTKIVADIDQGKLQLAEAKLAALQRTRSVMFEPKVGAGADGKRTDPIAPSGLQSYTGRGLRTQSATRTQSTSGNVTSVFTPADGADAVEVAATTAEKVIDLSNTVDDAEIVMAQRRLDRGETDIQSVIDLVEKKRALAEGQFGYESDEETALYNLRKQLTNQKIADDQAAADATAKAAKDAADAVTKAEKDQQDAIAKTTDELNRKKAALVDQADAHADLLDAIDAQAAAESELNAAQVSAYLIGINKKSKDEDRVKAAERVTKAQEDLAKSTIAGAQARARDAGLSGYDAAQNVADQLRQYIDGHGDPTGALGRELTRNSVGATGFVGAAGTANVTLNINLAPGANGDDVVNSISHFVSRNGPGSLKSILGITG